MTVRGTRIVVAVTLGCLPIGVHGSAGAFPVDGDQTALPPRTELNEDALDKPREIFRSESGGGGKSYLVTLANRAFSSPRREVDGAGQRCRATRRGPVPETVPARFESELRRLSRSIGRVRRSQAARCRLGRSFQDTDAAQCRFQRPIFP